MPHHQSGAIVRVLKKRVCFTDKKSIRGLSFTNLAFSPIRKYTIYIGCLLASCFAGLNAIIADTLQQLKQLLHQQQNSTAHAMNYRNI
jgi:hypothetical protein